MAKTKDFAKFLANQVESDEALADAIERERLNADIAVLIYSEREQAGLTQQELAEKAGTHQSVIARLEDAEYNGRTIELLRRVLHALGRRLAVSAEPLIEDTITAESDPPAHPRIYRPPTVSVPPARVEYKSVAQ